MTTKPAVALGDLVAAVFTPLLQDEFSMRLPTGHKLRCRLVEITQLRSPQLADSAIAAPSLRPEPFALLFQAEPGVAQSQGSVEFSHPELGELTLFIAPVASNCDGVYYEAVFN